MGVFFCLVSQILGFGNSEMNQKEKKFFSQSKQQKKKLKSKTKVVNDDESGEAKPVDVWK